MKVINNIFLSTVILIFLSKGVCAQDFKKDITTINKIYKESINYSMTLSYRVYENHSSLKAIDIQEGSIKKQGNSQLYKLGMIETLTNKKYTVLVDKESKQMIVGKNTGKMATGLPFDFENAYNFIEKTEPIKATENQRGYKLSLKNSEFKTVEIYFNTKTFFVEKFVLYYASDIDLSGEGGKKESPKMEVICTNISTGPISNNLFLEERYFTFTKTGLKPSANYSAYKVINNLHKN